MKEKIVVLNSGGFDSVVLLHHLRATTVRDIYPLHFLYGALNEKEQLDVVNKNDIKLGTTTEIIRLPKFTWTKGNFYKVNERKPEDSYLEYRNLIFLAYAISYAQSIGANEIYLATYGYQDFCDTNTDFISGLNSAINSSNIKIVTPFSGKNKNIIARYAIRYKINKEDYFSCDTPVNGKPCGKCVDCVALKPIEDYMKIDSPFKAFIYGGKRYSDSKFESLLKNSPVNEIRVLINNKCQLSCSHCFYGFDKMTSEQVDKKELLSFLEDGISNGVKSIHFAGKEPLFDEGIFYYLDNLSEFTTVNKSLVTNGLNIPKYAKRLSTYGLEKIILSVDDILGNFIRNTSGTSLSALDACEEYNIPIEVSIDIHEENYKVLGNIVDYLLERYSCIFAFHLRTIRTVGHSRSLPKIDIARVVYGMYPFSSLYPKIRFNLNIGIEYLPIIENDIELRKIFDFDNEVYVRSYSDNVHIYLEEYCNRYSGTYTVTPDGYVLGCAMEVANKEYAKKSIGNIKNLSFSELVNKGSEVAEKVNRCYITHNEKKCSFLL